VSARAPSSRATSNAGQTVPVPSGLGIALMADGQAAETGNYSARVRERMLLFCIANGTDWQHAGVTGRENQRKGGPQSPREESWAGLDLYVWYMQLMYKKLLRECHFLVSY
jgi:hypothetical protein